MGSVAGGYTLTVSGSDFEQGCTVLFHERYAPTVFINPGTLAATVPPGESGYVNITVSNTEGETDTMPRAFLYNEPPRIQSITAIPNPVVRNTTSTITVSALDPEAGLLQYEYHVAQGPPGSGVSGTSERVTFHSPNTIGTAVIQVFVYDEHRARTQGTLEIRVE
jgi:hypothetical protein